MRSHGAVVSNMHDRDVAVSQAMVRLRHRFGNIAPRRMCPPPMSRVLVQIAFSPKKYKNQHVSFKKQRSHTSLRVMQRMHETPLVGKKTTSVLHDSSENMSVRANHENGKCPR